LRYWFDREVRPFPEGRARGAAYLAVLILVLIISLAGLEFLKVRELETHLSQEAVRQEQARLAAEAGLNRAAWLLRRLPLLRVTGNPNPFHSRWYSSPAQPLKDTDFLQLSAPNPSDPFYPGPGRPYYVIGDVRGAGSKVRLRLLGSVDLNGNGLEGLTDKDRDGYPDLQDADPQDTNWFLETYLGLPGSLGKDLILAAGQILDSGGNQVSFQSGSEELRLAKDITVKGFLYDTIAGPRSFGTVVAGQILTGSPALPRHLFDAEGAPMESYFQGIPLKRLEGPAVLSRAPDPTSDLPPGGVLWVRGDVAVEQVDLETDWSRKDLVLVATGKLTLRGVKGSSKERLVLIAREVEVWGRAGDWLNAIVVASGDVSLLSMGQPTAVDCSGKGPCTARYLFGSVLAGGRLKILSQGWALVFDGLVLNGVMGWSPPTVLLDRFEGEGLGQWWEKTGGELAQGVYLQDEILHRAGDSGDVGQDGVAQVLRFTLRPRLADPGLGREARLILPGCPSCTQDWQRYSYLDMRMALDNYKRIQEPSQGVSLEVVREAGFKLLLRDEGGLELSYLLTQGSSIGSDKYLPEQWGTQAYRLEQTDVSDPDPGRDDYGEGVLPRWKRLRIQFSSMEGNRAGFDFLRVREVALGLVSWRMSWTRSDSLGSSQRELAASGNQLLFDPDGPGPMEASPTSLGPGGAIQWTDPASGETLDVPCAAPGDCWDLPPLKEGDLAITLRLDRLELPGATVMNHGFPIAFSLEPHLWRELGEQDLEP
jgi:hypothetical protein